MRTAIAFALLAVACAYCRSAAPHAATSNTVLFDREIVRILNEHCVMCHAQGGPSFSLSTYEQTWLARAAIHREVLAHRMPPWPAVPGYGSFANANALTLRETRFVVSWFEGLGPRNAGSVFLNVQDAAAREEIRAGIDFVAWTLGAPDVSVPLPATASPARQATESGLRVQRVVVDLGLDAERRVRALEYRPADRRALRAAVFTLEQTGQWLATWTPWYAHRELPDEVAFRLPAGTRVVAEFYTTADGPPLAASGELGLHFAAANAPGNPSDVVLETAGAAPTDARRQRLRVDFEPAMDLEVLALWPAPPVDTESLEVAVHHADGKVEVVLFAAHLPLDWPTPYMPTAPIALPAGSRLSVTAYASSVLPAPAERRLRITLSTVRTDVRS